MPRLPVRILLFLSSYAPLFWILAWRNRTCEATWLALAGIGTAGAVGLVALMWTYRDAEGVPLTVRRARPRDAEVLSYIASYLIPFFGLDLGDPDDWVTLLAFLAVLGVVYVNSSLLLVNPLLSVAGYRAWDIVDSDDDEYLLVSRSAPGKDQVIRPIKVGDHLRVIVR